MIYFLKKNNVVYPIDEEAGNSIKKLSDIIVVGGGPSARNIIRVENSEKRAANKVGVGKKHLGSLQVHG